MREAQMIALHLWGSARLFTCSHQRNKNRFILIDHASTNLTANKEKMGLFYGGNGDLGEEEMLEWRLGADVCNCAELFY